MSGTIYDRRRDIADYLRRKLEGDFIVVASPDHPLVMRSVDVLVGGRSGLTAIMTPTAEEIRRPRLLRSRLILNKMALPPVAKFVLIVSATPTLPNLDEAFSAVLSFADGNAKQTLASLSSDPQRMSRRSDVGKLQRVAERRFADTYRLSRILRRRSDEGAETEFSPREHRSRRARRDYLHGDVEGAFFDTVPTPRAVAELSAEGAERWFRLEQGEPEPTGKPAGVVFSFDYPRTRGDPDKVLRAGAFAGWVFAPFESARSPFQIADLVARFARLK